VTTGLAWVAGYKTSHADYGQWQSSTYFQYLLWDFVLYLFTIFAAFGLRETSFEQTFGFSIIEKVNCMQNITWATW
jgi:hypothetical protein